MIPLEMTTTSVAGKVKLYLAVPFPCSSRLAPPGPVPSSSSVHLRTRSWPAAARLEVAVRIHEPLKHPQDQGPEFGTRGPPRTLSIPCILSGPVFGADCGAGLVCTLAPLAYMKSAVLAHERAYRRGHELACRGTR